MPCSNTSDTENTLPLSNNKDLIHSKQNIDNLTLFSRQNPLFSNFLPVGRPNLGNKDEFMTLMNQIWDTRMLANRGPFVLQLEKEIASFLNVKHFISMCNGTVALEIAVRALGLHGEVIVPSFTFIATAHCLQWQEITPIFCDVDPVTHLLDPKKVEELITPKTTGIIGVHLWGQPCESDALQAIAKKHNIKLMFDAAHAFGSAYKGNKVGNFGDCEVFSFHATKFFNSFEGGGIATNNDELAKAIKERQNFGFVYFDKVDSVGTNGKMTEVCAAAGLVNLKALPMFISINLSHYNLYRDTIGKLPGLHVYEYDTSQNTSVNYQYIVIEVDEQITILSRDEIVGLLTAENISARRYFYPGCHKMKPYRLYFPHAGLLLPVTEKLTNKVFCLPTGTSITEQNIHDVSILLKFCLDNAKEIKDRISTLTYKLPLGPNELPLVEK